MITLNGSSSFKKLYRPTIAQLWYMMIAYKKQKNIFFILMWFLIIFLTKYVTFKYLVSP